MAFTMQLIANYREFINKVLAELNIYRRDVYTIETNNLMKRATLALNFLNFVTIMPLSSEAYNNMAMDMVPLVKDMQIEEPHAMVRLEGGGFVFVPQRPNLSVNNRVLREVSTLVRSAVTFFASPQQDNSVEIPPENSVADEPEERVNVRDFFEGNGLTCEMILISIIAAVLLWQFHAYMFQPLAEESGCAMSWAP
jgi:hypothetical protein